MKDSDADYLPYQELEEFEKLRMEARIAFIRRLQEEKMWGGNHVPRGQIMPSYRGLDANPALPAPAASDIVLTNAEASSAPGIPTHPASLVIDLRYRIKGRPERILKDG